MLHSRNGCPLFMLGFRACDQPVEVTQIELILDDVALLKLTFSKCIGNGSCDLICELSNNPYKRNRLSFQPTALSISQTPFFSLPQSFQLHKQELS